MILNTPIYMTPQGGLLHQQYNNYFQRFEIDPSARIVMHVTHAQVMEGNV